MRIFGGHRRYDRVGVAEVAQTSLLLLSNHEPYRGGCPWGLGIHDTVDIEKLCPVKIVGHVFLALGLSHWFAVRYSEAVFINLIAPTIFFNAIENCLQSG